MYLIVQLHFDGHFLILKSMSNDLGAVQPKLTEIEDYELFFCLKRHALKELRAQCVFNALA